VVKQPRQSGDDSEAIKGERIAKVIARAGLCSRREAERLIAAGRVAIDGDTIASPALTVLPGQRVTVDGEALPAAEPTRLWRFHKPEGVLTTASDPQGRRTVYDLLPPGLPRLMPVGRLDLNSAGLLLFTNDGALKRRLELPATGWRRRYRVRVYGRPEAARLAALAKGVTVEGVDYGPIAARLDSQSGANAWLTMTLVEGKNREIRRVCEHLGLTVNRLIRVAYGPFQLGKLAEGALDEVPAKVLREQLGLGGGATGKAKMSETKPDPAKKGGAKSGWAKAKPRPAKRKSAKPKPTETKPAERKQTTAERKRRQER
jgi:23S rRNA pseudouridine2605 synthase